MTVTIHGTNTDELRELWRVRRITREELHETQYIAFEYANSIELFQADQWEIYEIKERGN